MFDPGTREVFRNGQVVPLSPKAFQLLDILIRERPAAVSKEKLHEEIWPDTFVSDANLANLVGDLRAGLADDAKSPRIIRTVQRFGYAFSGDARPMSAADRRARPRSTAFRLIWGDREIALVEGENLLGRDEDCAAWIDVHSVSRHHARIVVEGGTAMLEDLESKNGTFVREERIDRPTAIQDGDEIRIGTVSMTLRLYRPGVSTETARS